jgi:hypothetical protein
MLSGQHSYQWLMSCDHDDAFMRDAAVQSELTGLSVRCLFGVHATKHEAVNADIDKADPLDCCVLVSDDMTPVVRGFDDIIAKTLLDCFPNLDGGLWFDDGLNAACWTLTIMGRKLYERLGYLYRTDYLSICADADLQQTCLRLGVLRHFQQTIIRHDHHISGRSPHDALYRKNELDEAYDYAVFAIREAAGFPL